MEAIKNTLNPYISPIMDQLFPKLAGSEQQMMNQNVRYIAQIAATCLSVYCSFSYFGKRAVIASGYSLPKAHYLSSISLSLFLGAASFGLHCISEEKVPSLSEGAAFFTGEGQMISLKKEQRTPSEGENMLQRLFNISQFTLKQHLFHPISNSSLILPLTSLFSIGVTSSGKEGQHKDTLALNFSVFPRLEFSVSLSFLS